MFPLIAISSFFILGIAFFAIGKDDFGIKRIKEDSNDTSTKENEVINLEATSNNVSTEGNMKASEAPLQEREITTNISD
tara:strand:+ start:321 stop:557 length:237 start_codon:yes stop_codon:yes gene_type:complete